MTRLLVAYHCYDGQTERVAEHIAHAPPVDRSDGVVAGGSIRWARPSRAVEPGTRR